MDRASPLPLPKGEIPRAAKVLAAAFDDDPFYRFLEPDDRARARMTPVVFESFLRVILPEGATSFVRDDDSSIAAVMALNFVIVSSSSGATALTPSRRDLRPR